MTSLSIKGTRASQVAQVKNLPANAGDAGDTASIPGLGRSPGEEEMATHSCILAWRIPCMEKLGGLQSMGLQRAGRDWAHRSIKDTESYRLIRLLGLFSSYLILIIRWEISYVASLTSSFPICIWEIIIAEASKNCSKRVGKLWLTGTNPVRCLFL